MEYGRYVVRRYRLSSKDARAVLHAARHVGHEKGVVWFSFLCMLGQRYFPYLLTVFRPCASRYVTNDGSALIRDC